ncbi:MAG: KpsF/GutQ family sugar-phosphate isomerase [Tepidisphaeraceae bacterium]
MEDGLLQFAREVIDVEAAAVARMREAIDEHFARAVDLVLACTGSLLASGVGKAGHVARKLSATFASTGTPSHFLSAPDAMHGDVGAVRSGDVVLLLSASGETDEILRLLSITKKLGHPAIAITATRNNSLARAADVTLATGKIDEACPLGLAPSASTTAMLALGDALALTVMKARKFTADDFFVYHPAGQLGRKLTRVSEAMTFRVGENLPVAPDDITVGEMLASVSRIKRRSGGVILTDSAGTISGFFSDGDLRRLVERDPAHAMRTPVAQVMTRNCKRVRADALASEALAIMKPLRIDELPVVDEHDRPVGLIDVQDLVVLKMFDVDER